MDKIRLALIVLHVLITIFHLYSKMSHTTESSETERQISSVIVYMNDLFRVSFYHSSCIIAIWFSRRYAAGVIRATGVLLIGEFCDVLAMTIKHLLDTRKLSHVELIFMIYTCLFLGAIVLTHRLAKTISKLHKDLMQLELLTTTSANDMAMDGRGDFALV